ncbi:hypothetical protein [Daejeonella oryzae]|uniref:hypothetical protein n=1 Tax=Daejeonella oryzae TaxID=1122943 RepID=UPI00040BEB6B|nr:hypothetical protein [Daejeonella oryzae]
MLKKTIAFVLLLALFFTFHESQAMHSPYYYKVKQAETPKKAVRNFLKWYEENMERLKQFDLISGKPGDSTKAYRVNFGETEKYLAELKKSGFVSDQYINQFRNYFKIADANLEKYPQYDGPAQGFEFDLVLQTHDLDETFHLAKKGQYVLKPQSPDTTKVYIRLTTIVMLLKLTRSGNSWLIDSLEYV